MSDGSLLETDVWSRKGDLTTEITGLSWRYHSRLIAQNL